MRARLCILRTPWSLVCKTSWGESLSIRAARSWMSCEEQLECDDYIELGEDSRFRHGTGVQDFERFVLGGKTEVAHRDFRVSAALAAC